MSVLRKPRWAESVYSALTQGGEATGLSEEKEPMTLFFSSTEMRPVIWRVLSKVSLLRQKHLDGGVLRFILDSLNPRRLCRSDASGSTIWDRLLLSSLSRHRFQQNRAKCKSLRKTWLWKNVFGVRGYHLIDIPDVTCEALQI